MEKKTCLTIMATGTVCAHASLLRLQYFNFETKSIKLHFKAENVITYKKYEVTVRVCAAEKDKTLQQLPENKPIILYILKAP